MMVNEKERQRREIQMNANEKILLQVTQPHVQVLHTYTFLKDLVHYVSLYFTLKLR